MKDLLENINLLKNSCKDCGSEIITMIEEDLRLLMTKDGLKGLIGKKKYSKIKQDIQMEKEIEQLQIELIKLQNWVYENKKRMMIIFEGRDTAGKSSAIKRFTEYLNPRRFRVVALPKPTETEAGQFFFQRYFAQLPNQSEIVFFDRSWYNRAIIEPLLGFCTNEQYEQFMKNVSKVEKALYNDGIIIIKFWFDIDREEQIKRFDERLTNPLKYWKLSPVDEKIKNLWNEVGEYKEKMFKTTHTSELPWIIIDGNNQKISRIEAIKYVLSLIPYDGKDEVNIDLKYKKDIVKKYHK
jgi:polyphosphate kinase